MSEYKKGDRVVVEIRFVDKDDKRRPYAVGEENSDWIGENDVLGKLEDFQIKQEKIKFTPEMKKEFDRLQSECGDLLTALDDAKYPLEKWLFLHDVELDNEHQYLFALAWHDPSLIEVVEPEKHTVKIGRQYLQLTRSNKFLVSSVCSVNHLSIEFTLDEVKEAEKQLGIQGLQAKWREASEKDGGNQ